MVDTYRTRAVPSVAGTLWTVNVDPQTRINDAFGDRKVGPPYWISFVVRRVSGTATRVRLHSIRFELADGTIVNPELSTGDNELLENGFTVFHANTYEELNGRLTLVADVEVFTPNGPTREEIVFPMVFKSRGSLKIP
jgi:hypothetical protein